MPLLNWSEQVFRYCERGQDAGFWAEPFNALSNGAFLVTAGLMLGQVAANRHRMTAANRAIVLALLAVAAAVGVGSFLFHTFATRWARLADVVPIGVFMGAYLVVALRLFLGWSWRRTLLSLAGFAAISVGAAGLACPTGLASVTAYAREPCLKGSMGYVPALAAMFVTAALLRQGHPALRQILLAAGVFAAAIVMRWLDRDLCPATIVFGHPRGTHGLWHLLTAATVYLLLGAALMAATAGPGKRASPRPSSERRN